jgi:hypothetical protein
VKIAAVYPGGGSNTPNTYLRDYVVLHNTGGSSVSLNGTSLQYGSATGNYGATAGNVLAFSSAHEIGPNGYFRIQCGAEGTANPALPAPPSVNAIALSMGLAAGAGKLAFVNQSAALNSKPTLPNVLILDAVSYGSADNAEGGQSANNGVNLTATLAIFRKGNGSVDTNNNKDDFTVEPATTANPPMPVSLSGFSLD